MNQQQTKEILDALQTALSELGLKVVDLHGRIEWLEENFRMNQEATTHKKMNSPVDKLNRYKG